MMREVFRVELLDGGKRTVLNPGSDVRNPEALIFGFHSKCFFEKFHNTS